MPSPLHLRQRLCACMLAHGAAGYERLIAPHKRRLFERLRGRGYVVEVGPGVGANLPYLDPRARYTALEPNVFMHDRLRRRAREAGIEMDLVPARIDDPSLTLPIEPGTVDAVVCTLVLCSVADPVAAAARIVSLLRPGGELLLIEHVGAPRGTLLRAVQRTLRPAWRLLADGCEPDRQTAAVIESAGFASVNLQPVRLPVPIVSPHIVGWAEK